MKRLKHENLLLKRTIGSMQAKIDSLMIEFCPEDMTREQWAEWGRHQRPVKDSDFQIDQPDHEVERLPKL